MEIRNLSFYRDTSFQEGAIEVPGKGYNLGTPSLILHSVHKASRDTWDTEISVAYDYISLADMTYMSFDLVLQDGTSMTFYGWIDSIDPYLDEDQGGPVTKIRWHKDLWMMWFSKARVVSGTVVRRKDRGGAIPPQNYPYIVRTLDKTLFIEGPGQDHTMWWLYMSYSYSVDEGKTVKNAWAVMPLKNNFQHPLWIAGNDGVPKGAVSGQTILSGAWDEVMGILPENIQGIYVSPFPPQKVTGNGEKNSPMQLGNSDLKMSLTHNADSTAHWWKMHGTPGLARTDGTLNHAITTNDTTTAKIVDGAGTVYGTIPYGLTVQDFSYVTVLSESGPYIKLWFFANHGNPGIADIVNAIGAGLVFNIPMQPLSLFSNSWSTYAYAGGRQAMMDGLRYQADNALRQGLTSIATTGLNTAMSGDIGKGVGSIVSQSISLASNQAWARGEGFDRMVDIHDTQHASQPDPMIMGGDGFLFTQYNSCYYLVTTAIDPYSANQRAKDILKYGVHVQEPADETTISSLITTRGPLKIENAIVTGNIPNEARAYIKKRLEGGVVIV